MSGRLVVVTGGGKGIGRAIVERFGAAGDRVTALGRDAGVLEETVRLVRERGGQAAAEVCDVTDEARVGELFERLGGVDVLVNNAGAAVGAPLRHTTLADWDHQLAVNATGVFLCTRAVLGPMLDRGGGRIVTVASVAGLAGRRYTGAYTAAKHAAVGLTRAVAAEVAGTGVTANAVCPAYVRTAMAERAVARIVETTGRTEEEALAALVATSPLGRLVEPAEVAAAVFFLASPDAAAINGQTLVLDGGGVQT